ncbi:MAG: ribonuclease P protein component [bacterium]
MDKQEKKFPLKRENRLRERKDFERLFSTGRKVENKYFKIIYTDNNQGVARVAVVLKRKFGHAVIRNKIRRRIKEIYRLNMDHFSPNMDYVIFPREIVKHISFLELKDNLLPLVEKCISMK